MLALTLPVLIQDGMFMDAVLYSSVSHNLSLGIGTFWFPQFSLHNVAGLNAFHEQPPLVFGIQAIFFKIFGSSLYVERFYTFLAMLINAWLIVLLWREVYKNNKTLQSLAWLPVLLWISVPVCFWSFSNNMHENTLSIFTLAAVLFSYRAIHASSARIDLFLLSGLFIFLASLSKGLPGFFPITIPLLFYFVSGKKSLRNALQQTFILVMVSIVLYSILLLFPQSKQSLQTYFFDRVLHRVNQVPTVESRWYIFGRLIMELLPMMLLTTILTIVKRDKLKNNDDENKSNVVYFFITIGLVSSLPLLITLVQKGFYLVPSLPFFAIAFSVLIAPFVIALVKTINNAPKTLRYLNVITRVLFIATLLFSFSQLGKTSRNRELLHDIYLIGGIVPQKSTVSIPPELWNNWDLQCYLMRYFNISLDKNMQHDFLVLEKSAINTSAHLYNKVSLSSLQFDLFRKK